MIHNREYVCRLVAACISLFLAAPSHADEGMWTFDNFPAEKVANAYGFRPDQKWLDHVRLSSVRLAGRWRHRLV